ncbi:MAG: leucyl aminopeptidase [Candidatus Hydrogenedentales bacterium]
MNKQNDSIMNINLAQSKDVDLKEEKSCLVLPLYNDLLRLQSDVLLEEDSAALKLLIDRKVVTGKASSNYFYATPGKKYQGVLILGLGESTSFTAEVLRRAAGKAQEILATNQINHVYFDISFSKDLPAEAFLEGLSLAQYRFETYKHPGDCANQITVDTVTIIHDEDAPAETIRNNCQQQLKICRAANLARNYANTAANEMTPETLAQVATQIAASKRDSCSCMVLDEAQMKALGMGALLGVAQGAETAPKLIVLEYRHPKASNTIALVGKGVTFDTGGISLKPAGKMHEMKFDMCGAAAVLGTFIAISELNPVLNVVVVIPAVTNMPDGRAQTPGDIVRAYNGKTIEVLNTDAEGRLILADALAYTIDKYKPDCIVDIATLTGAAVIALGHVAAAVLGTDDTLVEGLLAAGAETGELLWRLPLWNDYEKQMEGTFADLSNIGPDREAGTITGAAFLKAFTASTPWAHLDIAGTAYGIKNKSYLDSKYASGFGVRLLTNWLLRKADNGRN